MNAYNLSGFGCPQVPTMMGLGLGCPAIPKLAGPSGDTYTQTPTNDWSCAQWLYWHKDLAAAYQDGRLARYSKDKALTEANRVFMIHWDDVIPWYSPKKSFSSCSYDSDFVNYFKSVGLTDHISFIGALVSSATNTSVTAVDAAGQAAESVSKTTKTLNWVLPAVVVSGAVLGGLYIFNNYIKKKS